MGYDMGPNAYEPFYPGERHVLCTSRDQEGDFHGRVTDYLRSKKTEFRYNGISLRKL